MGNRKAVGSNPTTGTMKECRFCSPEYQKDKNILDNEHFFSIFDENPVTRGHALVIPKRHVPSFFELNVEEINAAFNLLKECKELLDKKFNPQGYNIGINEGKAAGQTLFHLHLHLIPRYSGDVPDPTGGVRHVIPEKGNYLKARK